MCTRTLVLALTIAVTGSTFLVSPTFAKYRVEKVEDGGTIRGVPKWKDDIPKILP